MTRRTPAKVARTQPGSVGMAAGAQELDTFVREALMRGQSREAIAQALAAAGWTEAQTGDVLSAYADVDFPVPVPRPRASLSAREAFLYLVLFASLYYAAFHVGSLLFDLINAAFPDARSEEHTSELQSLMRISYA